MKRWDGGAYVDLTVAKRWNGSAWVDLTIAKRWDGANWVDIPLPGGGGGALSATVNRGSVVGSIVLPHAGSPPVANVITSQSVTVTATGGTAPYTYLWTKLAGDSAVVASQLFSATSFFNANVPRNQDRSATMRCTITDAAAATFTVDISASLNYFTDL